MSTTSNSTRRMTSRADLQGGEEGVGVRGKKGERKRGGRKEGRWHALKYLGQSDIQCVCQPTE